jgi:two-component sensor histidine kinase
MTEGGPTQRTEQLDVIVELLSELDSTATDAPRAFYDRLCDAVCRLTTMERAGLLLYDEARKLVVPAGNHGLSPELVRDLYGTLEETPIAQRALAEDRVVEASTGLEGQVPDRYARLAELGTRISCTPVAAGGRWLGVIFADRGGGEFELTDAERHTMWTLGKTAALVATVRIATTEAHRARLLDERVAVAREVHEQVIQRLFGVSLVLGAKRDLGRAERKRAAEEIHAALGDLRDVLARPVGTSPPSTGATLREELDRLGRHYEEPPLEVRWETGAEVPSELEPLAGSFLAEALRNAHKHARPTRVTVRVRSGDGAFTLEVRNDGVGSRQRGRGAGMGLRLAALDALQHGGVVEFGEDQPEEWRARLVVPLDGDS